MRTIITSLALLTCLSASAQNIVLDPDFGNDGISYLENTNEIQKIILNPDGTIISAGSKIAAGSGYHIVISKHDELGNLDVNFGTGGITNTDLAHSDVILDLQLQADGKILLAGTTYTGLDTGPGGSPVYHAFVIRYHSNGIIDSSFATNGIFRDTNYYDSQFTSILVQSNQSLLLTGNADNICYLTKLTSAGVLDSSFGTNGMQPVSNLSTFFFINQGAISLSDGSILFYGLNATNFPSYEASCIKTDVSGNFITSFGQNGIVSLTLNPNESESFSKAQELPDGKIILAGGQTNGSKLISKLKANGIPDSTFATNGTLDHTLPFKEMLVQPNGKILIGGSAELTAFNYGISVSRFNADGTIDLGFNGTGTFEADLSERNDFLQSMVLIGPDHLLVGGSMRPIDFNSVFGLAQIDMSQTLDLETNKPDDISIYPNPFTSELIVSIGNEKIKEIQLKDASGRMIGNYPANTTLFLDHLPAGMYQAIFTNDQQESISRKIIKM